MKEMYNKLPELINMLLEQVSKSNLKTKPYIKDAHNKLISTLKSINKEISKLKEEGGNSELNDQIDNIIKNILKSNIPGGS